MIQIVQMNQLNNGNNSFSSAPVSIWPNFFSKGQSNFVLKQNSHSAHFPPGALGTFLKDVSNKHISVGKDQLSTKELAHVQGDSRHLPSGPSVQVRSRVY